MLFTPADLGEFMRDTAIDVAAATQAQRVASGWLQSATGLTEWPEPVTDDLYGWALQLGAAIYSNPTGLVSLTVEELTYGYGGDQIKDILAAAGRRRSAGGSGGPRFSFPAPSWGETGYVSG